MSTTWLLALFGLLLLSSTFHSIHAEDAMEDEDEMKEELESGIFAESHVPNAISPPDADIEFVIIEPEDAMRSLQLIAGKLTKFFIRFANKDNKDLSVRFFNTSLRLPKNLSVVVQNFTSDRIDRTVVPENETIFDFAFNVSEKFIGYPLQLFVEVHYSNVDGDDFHATPYNQTVFIIEDESVSSVKDYFLVFIGISVALILAMLGLNLFPWFSRKPHRRIFVQQEIGTATEIDPNWLPIRERKLMTTKKHKARKGH